MALTHEQSEWLSVQAVPCTAILSALLAVCCPSVKLDGRLFRILVFFCFLTLAFCVLILTGLTNAANKQTKNFPFGLLLSLCRFNNECHHRCLNFKPVGCFGCPIVDTLFKFFLLILFTANALISGAR